MATINKPYSCAVANTLTGFLLQTRPDAGKLNFQTTNPSSFRVSFGASNVSTENENQPIINFDANRLVNSGTVLTEEFANWSDNFDPDDWAENKYLNVNVVLPGGITGRVLASGIKQILPA